MKIGIDARMYGYAQTGIGNYIRHLLKYVFKLDKENKYIIFLLPEEYEDFELPNERIKKIKVHSRWYGWKEQFIFPLDLYKEKLDLIHFTHFNSPILYFKKSVVTIHDITPYFFPGHKMKSIIRKVGFRTVFYSSVVKASKVIAVSENTKKDIIKHFKIDQNKIKVIYEGVDKELFNPSLTPQPPLSRGLVNYLPDKGGKGVKNKKLSKKYNIAKPFIFYAGVWRNHKNLAGLIKAFDILKNKYKLDYQLVLGGKEDSYYPEVRKTWEKLGLDKDIIRTGFIRQEELPLFYNAAKLFIIPSLYEGFGLIGLEAMASGTPVVSSNRTSLPEILGEAAIYFNPENHEEMAEKINLVLSSEKLYNELIEKGFEQIERYSWERMGRETLEIYKEVLNG